MDKLAVTILGGASSAGSCNSLVLEYGPDAIVVDMGLGFPEFDLFGVDYLIPNIEYLRRIKNKLKAIVITHGHLDHIGALPYVLEELGWPTVYAPRMAAALIKARAEEFGQLDQMKIHVFEGKDKFKMGAFDVGFARVTHNIPDSYSVMVDTPVGKVVHTGDFKFDTTPYKEPPSEYAKFTRASEEGVLLLVSDSTNALKSGWSDSESSITPELEYVIEKAKGRVIASTFASLITRLSQVIDIASAQGRRIAVSGRSMERTVAIARNLGMIEVPDKVFISQDDANRLRPQQVCILATGSQGEETSSLVRMSTGTHPTFQLTADDTVILSSSVIPGNELAVYRLRDELAKRGATVFHNELMDVHAGGHPHVEDLKLMIELNKPKYLMPFMGSASQLYAHMAIAESIGFSKANVVIPENGRQFLFSAEGVSMSEEKFPSDPVLVDGYSVGDVGKEILSERAKLADDGIVFISIADAIGRQDRSTGSAQGASDNIKVVAKGFMYVADNQVLFDDIKRVVQDALQKGGPTEKLRTRVESMVSQFLGQKTGRSPMVIAV